ERPEIVDARDDAPVLAEGELRLLMSVAQAGRGGEPLGIEAVDGIRLVAEAAPLAEEADPRLAPGAGDDELIGERPVDSVEGGRLVIDVDDADRNDDDSGAQVERLPLHPVEERLLHLELALIAGGG